MARATDATLRAALAAARARFGRVNFIGELELYCANPDCVMREISARVKEHDTVTPPSLACPACRTPLKLQDVLTREELIKNRRREARISVNVELYQERERRRLGLRERDAVPVPIRALLDDSLPLVES